MYDATYRATREFVIAQMDQGVSWQDATDRAPLAISRATAYRIWLRSWREGPAVLQHAGRRLICCGDPHLADDRQSGRDDRCRCPQRRDAGGRIAKERLTGEINVRHGGTHAA